MNVFSEVRERTDIVEAAKRYGLTPNRAGKCLCPFHGERTPSFSLSREKRIWHCFGCGAGGDVVSLVARLLNIRPIEAARRLNEDFSLGIEELVGRKYTPAEKRKFAREREKAALSRLLHKAFDESIEQARQTAAVYCRQLYKWTEECKPESNGEPDPRFVFAMQNLSRAEGLREMFERGDRSELLDWYIKNHGEILKYEAMKDGLPQEMPQEYSDFNVFS